MSQTNIHQFLFAFISISLKVAFKNTSIKKVHFGENFTVKCKIWDKIQNLKATKPVFMPPKELWEAYSNHTVHPSVRQSVRPSGFRVLSISPILFEVGIPNLVCGYILGWRSVAYHFWVTLTLTSDLFFFYNNRVRSISLILFDIEISNLVCGCIMG